MTSEPFLSVSRGPQRIDADSSRVITRLFVPGQEGFEHQESRAGVVLRRLLALNDADVRDSLRDIMVRFDSRHRDLRAILLRHAGELADRFDPDRHLGDERMMLLGATFTNEYAIEGAALCNPSLVVHPDQSGVLAGSLRFVMSVRGIGEGHVSSLGFRTGVVDATGAATIDETARYASTGSSEPVMLDAAVFRAELAARRHSGEVTDFVFGALGALFTRSDLDERLDCLLAQRRTRGDLADVVATIRDLADRFYGVGFESGVPLSERVLWPAMAAERAGMEDARFVRFVDDDGAAAYYASYTAYSGSVISQQLLQTDDFSTFVSVPLAGSGAANKGLALFPRRVGGRFAALSRADRESNSVTVSDHLQVWPEATPCQQPSQRWETLQLGNCGPPIETEAGWLVLTHGVGPMRTYSIGAILLDLDDPTRMIGRLRRPLLAPADDERDGYVPNVVYSCGSLIHADTLVIPYGMSDNAIGIASVPVDEVLAQLTRP